MFRPDSYLNEKGFSQSDMKLFEESPKKFYEQVILGNRVQQGRKQCYDVGDLTDIFLLQQDLIPNYGTISASPSEKLIEVCKNVYERAKFESKGVHADINMYGDYIIAACKALEYYYNAEKDKWSWKVDTVKSKVQDEGKDYFEQYVKVMEAGKTEVLKSNWDKAEECENKVWAAEQPEIQEIATLLDPENTIPDHVKVLKAYAQTATFRNHKVKHLGDLAIIDEDMNTVRGIDLKTADSHIGFMRNYWGLSYIRQGALTSAILVANFPNYVILPFTFLVVPKNDEVPELYEMSPQEMNAGLMGGTFKSGKRFRGVAQILDDIQWHIDNGVWEHKRSYYEKGNKNILNSFEDANAELFIGDIF